MVPKACRQVVCFLAFLCVAFAQNPADLLQKAPPDVDEALRARIKLFYQAHVDGKFRAADQVVAEDSKDVFFSMEKRRYKRFEILQIQYSDNFTKAKALLTCTTDFQAPMMQAPVQVDIPMTSLWKIENGQWFWYVDNVKPDRGGPAVPSPVLNPQAGPPPAVPAMPADPSQLLNLVTADKKEVRLDCAAGEPAEVKILNRMPGQVRLELDKGRYSSLDLKLEPETLKSNESATLTIGCRPDQPGTARPSKVAVHVEPTGSTIVIQVATNAPRRRTKAP